MQQNAVQNGSSNEVPSSIIYEPELVIRSSTAAREKSISENLVK
ncbi:hypothetical protein [Mesobacillus maritimus]|nr:hypothetical protein [Mesobacillus maritimus]